MSIQKIQQSGYAQIANGALRDKRLSWRARGLLAFVLSHPDNFNAPRDWLVKQSDNDGEFVVRSILKELDSYGYRKVVRSQNQDKSIRTDTYWFQYPYGDPAFVYPWESVKKSPFGGIPT